MNLLKLSIDRPVFITMITIFIGSLGLIFLNKLPLDLFPNVSYPVLSVRADLEGAAPEEIEQQITKKIEDTLSTLSGVKMMRSQSREGVSNVSVEFDIGDDIRFQETQARAKIANIRKSLPADMSEPRVFRQDPDEDPIMEIVISGSLTASELSDLAEELVGDKLRQIEGVGDLDISGGRTREVQVDLNPESLDTWKINASEIVQAIQKFNRNDPIGKLEGNDFTWVARSISLSTNTLELGNIPVGKTTSGSSIFLKDIAKIKVSYADVQRLNQIHDPKNTNGAQPAVVIGVIKQSGSNTVEISRRVRDTLSSLQEKFPLGVSARISRDNAELVQDNVADVYESLIIAALLTVAVVLLFLQSYRATLTTGLALPSSVITTFFAMGVAGFTINIMTLLALSLSIGLLVDDAIVVRENIFRHLQMGKSGRQAALDGASEVVLAVVATSATIVAVFLPVAFMGGLTGQFFKSFALTVVFAMLISLWDSLTAAPMLSAHFANIPHPSQEWSIFGWPGRQMYHFLEFFEKGFSKLEKMYAYLLKAIVPRWYIALTITLLSLWAAAQGFTHVKKTFLPAQLGPSFRIQLEGPTSKPLEKISEVSTIVDERLKKVDLLEWWTISASSGFNGNASVGVSARSKPEFNKNQKKMAEVRSKIRKALSGIPGYQVRISEPADPLSGAAGGGRFQPIAVTITGPEFATTKDVARRVRKLMQEVNGLIDVASVQDSGLAEVKFQTNPIAAAQYGTTAEQVATNLDTWVLGNASQSLRTGDTQVPIRVRLENGKFLTPNQILQKNVFVKSTGGNKSSVGIPLASFVTASTGAGATVIFRENRKRTLRLGANLEASVPLNTVVKDLESKLKSLVLPTGYDVMVVGQNVQMQEAASNIGTALALGSLFVYMVLASLFESFLLPITVMIAIPLAASGAVLSLLWLEVPLDLYGGIGLVLLAGIVAKNSILLVDFAAQRVRDHKQEPRDAIIESAPLRLKPILMTSIAMVIGMLPVALGMGATGASRQALGITTIGGVISSTLLTLLVVPNFYLALEKLRKMTTHKIT